MHIVYKTTNLVNGKYYIGKHSCHSKCRSIYNGKCNYLGSGLNLVKAITKYGVDNFKRETLASFQTSHEAYEHEAKIVDASDRNSYNICGGGDGVGLGVSHPRFGMKHTEETKLKQSQAQSGDKNHNYGKKLSKQYRAKISESQKGNTTGKQYRDKISKTLKGRPRPPAIAIFAEGAEYPSLKSAARALSVTPRTIKSRLNRGVYSRVKT